MGDSDWVGPVVGAAIGLAAINMWEKHQKKHSPKRKRKIKSPPKPRAKTKRKKINKSSD
jgi:hypothetical protein